jgi:hypothetical protein
MTNVGAVVFSWIKAFFQTQVVHHVTSVDVGVQFNTFLQQVYGVDSGRDFGIRPISPKPAAPIETITSLARSMAAIWSICLETAMVEFRVAVVRLCTPVATQVTMGHMAKS